MVKLLYKYLANLIFYYKLTVYNICLLTHWIQCNVSALVCILCGKRKGNEFRIFLVCEFLKKIKKGNRFKVSSGFVY